MSIFQVLNIQKGVKYGPNLHDYYILLINFGILKVNRKLVFYLNINNIFY